MEGFSWRSRSIKRLSQGCYKALWGLSRGSLGALTASTRNSQRFQRLVLRGPCFNGCTFDSYITLELDLLRV